MPVGDLNDVPLRRFLFSDEVTWRLVSTTDDDARDADARKRRIGL